MNDTRSKTVLSLLAVLMLLFTFGLGALSSYVFLGGARAANALPPDNGVAVAPRTTATALPAPAGDRTPAAAGDLNGQMQELYQVLDLLKQESYYRPMDDQKLVYGAIQGMMAAVDDPYTRFETPSQNAITQQQMQGES